MKERSFDLAFKQRFRSNAGLRPLARLPPAGIAGYTLRPWTAFPTAFVRRHGLGRIFSLIHLSFRNRLGRASAAPTRLGRRHQSGSSLKSPASVGSWWLMPSLVATIWRGCPYWTNFRFSGCSRGQEKPSQALLQGICRAGTKTKSLDSRAAKTPGGNDLALPTLAAARALANEWAAVGEIIDPALMPLTRLVNSAIDGVAPRLAITVAEIARYAGSDLVCYRAGEPQALARASRRLGPDPRFRAKKARCCFHLHARRGVHRSAGSRLLSGGRGGGTHRRRRPGRRPSRSPRSP